MESIIGKIIELDREADKRLTDAVERSRKQIENSEHEASVLRESIDADAVRQISEIRLFHKNETEKQLADISADCDEKIRLLDEAFESRHETIEKEIFRAIVGDVFA